MPASKAKTLSSLFRSALKTNTKTQPSSVTSPATEDRPLKYFVSSLDTSATSPSTTVFNLSAKSPRPKSNKPAGNFSIPRLELEEGSNADDSTKQLSKEIYTILCADALGRSPDVGRKTSGKALETVLEIPWFSTMSHNNISKRRKEVLRERKQKWIFKNTQIHRFDKLVKMCANKLGTEATLQVFGKLGRETGVKEYNSLIGICVQRAKECDNEDVALEQISKAFQLFNFMKEHGFQLEEETYGPLLMYFIDMCMVEEFHFFCKAIENGNSGLIPRLGYYEMLLWIRVDDEEKIQELYNRSVTDYGGDYFNLLVNYLLALCESERKSDLLQLLEIVDMTKVSSLDHVTSIFKSLGRLELESLAEKYLLAFKRSDLGADNVSNVIFSYTSSIPNLAVEDVVSKFNDLHVKLEITPSSVSYEKLIAYSCDLDKVHVALDILEQMSEAGLMTPIDTLNSVLHACEDTYEFNLVRQVYTMICCHKLKPNSETFRSMISLSVKMKDFDGAYALLNDLKKMNLMPTASMYNAIMGGYFRKKDMDGALMVLKRMEMADVKPDSQTFSYLIQNCSNEEDIIKYYEEMKCYGVQPTKQVFMALIAAYATCGEFEKAKQVILDKGIPVKILNEIKGSLVSALASHGQMSDALSIYEEIKQAGCSLEPKAAIALIEHLNSEEEFSKLCQLLEELDDPEYWIDGCCRLICHSVRFKHLSSAIVLFKKLKDKIHSDEQLMEVLLAEVFSLIAETEPADVQIGLHLLKVIKDELGLLPPRKCLDFLLSACVNAKDLQNSLLIWKEYQTAGLPYNVFSFLRMYQALLASGDRKSARKMLSKIPKDDPHVRNVIKACRLTYDTRPAKGKKKNKDND